MSVLSHACLLHTRHARDHDVRATRSTPCAEPRSSHRVLWLDWCAHSTHLYLVVECDATTPSFLCVSCPALDVSW